VERDPSDALSFRKCRIGFVSWFSLSAKAKNNERYAVECDDLPLRLAQNVAASPSLSSFTFTSSSSFFFFSPFFFFFFALSQQLHTEKTVYISEPRGHDTAMVRL
jgi:hypothetical protein